MLKFQKKGLSMLYIHIPFCNSKCYYCAFNSYIDKNYLKKNYFESLKKQFQNEQKPNKFSSIFIGGGTPSVMNIDFYEKLFYLLSDYIDKETEISIEINPNSLNKEWLQNLKKLGVNRVSFGIQSFNDKKLKFLGRNHSSKEGLKSIEKAKNIFENINLDLIYSTAIDTETILNKDLEIAIKLGVQHISAYSLTIEKNTKFENYPEKRKENEELELYFIEKIKEHFFQYEISNFGKICKHNLGYWQLKEYIGIGAGAVGYQNGKRYYTHNLIENYIKNPTFKRVEKLKKSDIVEEKVLLGLRSIVGFEKEILNKEQQKRAFELADEKKIIFKKNRFYSKDFLLADAIALYIL